MGPAVDSAFDDLLDSLARIAQKLAEPVVDSILRWKKGYEEQPLPSGLITQHMSSPPPGKVVRPAEIEDKLIRRRDVSLLLA